MEGLGPLPSLPTILNVASVKSGPFISGFIHTILPLWLE